MQAVARKRQRRIEGDRARRRVVENEHRVREQCMTGAHVDHAAAAKEPPRTTRSLPRFVQFLAGQAAGVADGPSESMKECVVRKPVEIAIGEASAR
jgi:hypothetical protein